MFTMYVKQITILQMINDLKFCLHLIKSNRFKALYKIESQTKINTKVLLRELKDLFSNVDNGLVIITTDYYTSLINKVVKLVNECNKLV